MELDEIIKKSKHTKQIADKILKSSNLTNILSKFGDPEIIGSYKYDLMYGPDLDIIVETDKPRLSSVNALTELIQTESFSRYEYGDFVKFSRINRPHGYIIVLKIEVDDVKWEIEIWFLNKNERPQNDLETLMINLTENQRKEILKLKHEREESDINKNNLSGMEIYKKVLTK